MYKLEMKHPLVTCGALRCHNYLLHVLTNIQVDFVNKTATANPQHALHHLLPSRTQHSYKLRPRRHDCSPTVKSDASLQKLHY